VNYRSFSFQPFTLKKNAIPFQKSLLYDDNKIKYTEQFSKLA